MTSRAFSSERPDPKPDPAFVPRLRPASLDDMLIFARTIWGEARSEPLTAQVAVGWVIRNRVQAASDYQRQHGRRHPLFGDGSLSAACLAPWQFSCWNRNDPNRPKLLATGFHDPSFTRSFAVACLVWSGERADPTDGSTHYHTVSVAPAWSRGLVPVARIGSHLFFNKVS